ncbi:MAG TPA: phosphatase PAP2 family protein [Sphingomicrobium sp.]|nr:phosphatase PAP2 family protein [Sphingomicrobium sp.]
MDRRKRNVATVRQPWVLPVLLAVWLAMLLLGGRDVDQAVIRSVHVGGGGGASLVVLWTGLGDWSVLLAATSFGLAWLLYRRQWRPALLLAGWTLLGRLLVELQKVTFARLRPEDDMPMVVVNGFSFPSGHAANSTIVYLMLALLVTEPGPARRRALIAAAIVAALVGISRVLLGVHWPSDVIAGWAFGLAWVLIGWRIAQTLKRNSKTSPS